MKALPVLLHKYLTFFVTVRLLVPLEASPHSLAILTATRMSIPHSLAILPLKVEDIPHLFAIYQPSNSHPFSASSRRATM